MNKSPEKYKIRFIIGAAKHQGDYARALQSGMNKRGFTDTNVGTYINPNEDHDLIVMWAHKRHNIMQQQKKIGKPYLVMERAYVGDRHHWVSVGFNGLNGRANFMNQNITDMTRWNTHFKDYVKPWRVKKDSYAVVVGQVAGDASHRHINIQNWYQQTINELNRRGVPVVFRPHPLDRKTHYKPAGDYVFDKNLKLEDTLKDARCCVTYNSNSGVISALMGVPTVCHDIGSMAYNVATNMKNLDYTPDRDEWLAKLAYTQWLPHELEDGTAWAHLEKGLDESLT